MTTIAIKNGVVAVDSLVCRGDRIVSSEYDKARQVGDMRFIFAGSIAVYDRLVEIYKEPDRVREDEDIDGCAVVIENRQAWLFTVVDGEPQRCTFLSGDAEGSGSDFAVAAMALGKTAAEAVQVAAGLDAKTGGAVRAYRVDDGKEITQPITS